jgi:thymidylate synthase (FAD)|nr:MAG TPA: Thymidylate synthase complementing protein [Crassvirales sp.]
MRLIKPYLEIWEQLAGLEGVYKQIERAGRVCYKSEDKITEDSAKPFVDNRLIKSGHYAMLEHGTVYLKRDSTKEDNLEWAERYLLSPYSRISYGEGSHRINGVLHNTVYVTTNYRVIIEQGWLDDLQYICEPTEYHERRVTVHFVCDRGVSHEFVRHRVMSFAQESTRYCNYSKDKFNNELTFIQPCWLDDERLKLYGPYHTVIRDKSPESIFIANLNNTEKDYLDLIKLGWKPQEARAVLPNSLKTELIVTGFVSDWEKFFRLRSRIAETGKPHPQAQELADPLMDEFVKRGIMETLL